LPVPASHPRETAVVLPNRKPRPIPRAFDNRAIKKGNLSYLAIISRCAKFHVNAKKERKKKQTMKLQINVPVSGLDLAGLLQGEEGLFLCQNRGQDYIAVAKAGHSIAYGPTPIGRVIIEQPSTSLGPEPWFVTKISNSTEFAEFRGTSGAPGGSRSTS
jgi:hypothetical protein